MRRPLLALFVIVAMAGCASRNVTFTGKLKYRQTPEENYNAGLDETKHENWVEAVKFFEYVKTKYPFSKYSPLSELRLADLKFKQGRFVEAADAYQQFVQLHPTHEEVDYAEFRVGVAHLKEAPSDFFLFPPSHEKDQRAIEKAVIALKDFVQSKPDSKYAKEAKALLADAQARLAAHEWYVAEYYYKREHWAAAGRYERLVNQHPGSRYEAEALMKLARSSVKLDEKHRARTALQKLIVAHPEDKRRAEAEKLLAALR